MRWIRTAGSALALAAALTAATACSDGGTVTTPSTSTVTVTASTAASAAPATDADPTAGSGDSVGDSGTTRAEDVSTPCGPQNLSRATIDAAIAKITPDPLGAWVPRESNFSTCNDISYVVLENGGGMSASDDQLLIFGKQGNFLGTGIRCITSRQNVQSAGPDFVNVSYSSDRWLNPSAHDMKRVTYPVTFRWNGSRVVMEGTLPYEITQGRC